MGSLHLSSSTDASRALDTESNPKSVGVKTATTSPPDRNC